MLHSQAVDHLVLLVEDVERSVAWYRDLLGMPAERLEEWRAGEAPFPSVRINESTIIDVFPRAAAPPGEDGRNLDHFCVVVEPTDLRAVIDSGVFDVRSGPVERWGARGNGTSIYVRDPDGNVVELRHYGNAEQGGDA